MTFFLMFKNLIITTCTTDDKFAARIQIRSLNGELLGLLSDVAALHAMCYHSPSIYRNKVLLMARGKKDAKDSARNYLLEGNIKFQFRILKHLKYSPSGGMKGFTEKWTICSLKDGAVMVLPNGQNMTSLFFFGRYFRKFSSYKTRYNQQLWKNKDQLFKAVGIYCQECGAFFAVLCQQLDISFYCRVMVVGKGGIKIPILRFYGSAPPHNIAHSSHYFVISIRESPKIYLFDMQNLTENSCRFLNIKSENNVSGSCKCERGFYGKYCEHQYNYCLQNPCSKTGSTNCLPDIGSFICKCKKGYTGKRCENNYCLTNPCQNGGNCMDLFNNTQCACPKNRNGKFCEITPKYDSLLFHAVEPLVFKLPFQPSKLLVFENLLLTFHQRRVYIIILKRFGVKVFFYRQFRNKPNILMYSKIFERIIMISKHVTALCMVEIMDGYKCKNKKAAILKTMRNVLGLNEFESGFYIWGVVLNRYEIHQLDNKFQSQKIIFYTSTKHGLLDSAQIGYASADLVHIYNFHNKNTSTENFLNIYKLDKVKMVETVSIKKIDFVKVLCNDNFNCLTVGIELKAEKSFVCPYRTIIEYQNMTSFKSKKLTVLCQTHRHINDAFLYRESVYITIENMVKQIILRSQVY